MDKVDLKQYSVEELKFLAEDVEKEIYNKTVPTHQEVVILKGLNKPWTNLFRNRNGELFLCEGIYKKNEEEGVWEEEILAYRAGNWDFNLFKHLFKYVRWEDDYPTEINKIINNEWEVLPK